MAYSFDSAGASLQLILLSTAVCLGGCAGGRQTTALKAFEYDGSALHASVNPGSVKPEGNGEVETIGILVGPMRSRNPVRRMVDPDARLLANPVRAEAASATSMVLAGEPAMLGGGLIISLTTLTSQGVGYLVFHSRRRIRRVEAALSTALADISVSADIQGVLTSRAVGKVSAAIVSLDPHMYLADGKAPDYDKLEDRGIDLLVVVEYPWVGVIGDRKYARLVMQSDLTLVNLAHRELFHRQTVWYAGRERRLDDWSDDNAVAFSRGVKDAYGPFSDKIVAVLIEGTVPQAFERKSRPGFWHRKEMHCADQFCGD